MRLMFLISYIYISLVLAAYRNEDEKKSVIETLTDVLDFIEKHYYEINFDGLLGVVIAESQLLQIQKFLPHENVLPLIFKCELIQKKIKPNLPTVPKKYIIFNRFLLNPLAWINNTTFVENSLENLGVYTRWTARTILDNKSAVYRGVQSDVCVLEILEQNSKECQISSICSDMMLASRVDTGYLLTHRLLYLQIARIKGCYMNEDELQKISNNYCALMLKEARTNQLLGFPQHDIILEQILLCGLEGFEEFLTKEFRSLAVKWKSNHGCFYPDSNNVSRRSANRIDFGCTDHATGLGAAVLALNLRYITEKTLKA